MDKDDFSILILIIFAGIIGYLIAINNCNNSISELKDLKIKFIQLNDSYNQKVQENLALKIENEQLKSQQKRLQDQIATYFVEQASIDLLGLKKYDLLWGLVKIGICDKNPSFILC